MSLPIALQLYTVRDELARDFEGTLAKVAQIGYRYVEIGALSGRAPKELRGLLEKLGLQAISAHMSLDILQNKLQAAIAEGKALGYRHLVLSWVGPEFYNPEGYRKVAHLLTEAGKQATDAGMGICYHNHSFEFAKLADGSRGIDILYDESEDMYVKAELDVYWVQHGGDDPLVWMEKLSGRLPLLHIKDMAAGPDRAFTEVGTGVVNIAAVVKNAAGVGARYLIVEQDSNWKGSPLESAKISYDNLKKIVG